MESRDQHQRAWDWDRFDQSCIIRNLGGVKSDRELLEGIASLLARAADDTEGPDDSLSSFPPSYASKTGRHFVYWPRDKQGR